MNKLIALAVVVIAAYFLFLRDSTFEKDLNFDGTTFSHVKEMRGGEITNHFYTPNGEDFSTANSFVQIVELSEAMQAGNWQDSLKPLHTQYQLAPIENQSSALAGSFEKSGLFFNSYAAPIAVEGTEHMAFYVTTNGEYNNETCPTRWTSSID